MYHLLVNVYIAANPGVFPPNMDLDLYESPDQLQDSFRNIFARNIGGGVRPRPWCRGRASGPAALGPGRSGRTLGSPRSRSSP